jgi:hypothetical protein
MECKRPITRKYWGDRVIYRQAEYGVMQIFRPLPSWFIITGLIRVIM